MIDIVSPPAEFNVVQFRKKALSILDSIVQREKIPIIVGGTNYYVESLLWNFSLDHADNEGNYLCFIFNFSLPIPPPPLPPPPLPEYFY